VKHKGLYQLLCAATVDSEFRETLLCDAPRAMLGGYLGQTFSLTPEEWALVASIKARKLEDLATQIHRWVSTNGNGNGNGYGNGYGNGHNGDGHDILAKMERQAELFRGS
jgi:hypothetical protein